MNKNFTERTIESIEHMYKTFPKLTMAVIILIFPIQLMAFLLKTVGDLISLIFNFLYKMVLFIRNMVLLLAYNILTGVCDG